MPRYGKSIVAGLVCSITIAAASAIGESDADREVDAAFPPARALYEEIHRHPELSEHEVDTAARIARALGKAGYQVTAHVGGNGVVGVLKNGSGPTVMLRTELDALPVEEKTGLPYASTVKVRGDGGAEVPVMHACGHDLHMASLVAVARIMAGTLDSWHGTLVLVGEPGEEGFDGAGKMLADGLFTRFPKPDAVLALHVSNSQPAGSVGVVAGTYNSSSDSLRITLYGRGGHGSAPHTAIDPVVMAAKVVLGLQTIASREIKPGEFAVVTVGYLHAGTKNNIIPDSAELGLTVRSYKPEIRKQLLAAIERTVMGEALAAGAPRESSIERLGANDSVYNDPALTRRMAEALRSVLGPKSVETIDPITASEDFSRYLAAGVPGFYLALGGAAQEAYSRAVIDGRPLPSNHSSLFAPDVEPALRTAIRAELAMLRDLLQGVSLNLKSAGAGQQ